MINIKFKKNILFIVNEKDKNMMTQFLYLGYEYLCAGMVMYLRQAFWELV